MAINTLLMIAFCVATSPYPDDDYFSRNRPTDQTARNQALDAMETEAAPSLDAESWLNSSPLTWKKLEGKVVLLDFWGVWCGPCREAIPELTALHEKYKELGLVVIGVHTKEMAKRGKKFVESGAVTYAVLFDKDDKTAERFKIITYPSIYLIDHKGKLRFADIIDFDLNEAVEKLVGERQEALNDLSGEKK